MTAPGDRVNPCKIVQAFKAAEEGKALEESSVFKAVQKAIQEAHIPATSAALAGAPAVPGDSMRCTDFKCHDAFPRKLPKNAVCLGGGCVGTCCEGGASAKVWRPRSVPTRTSGGGPHTSGHNGDTKPSPFQ